MGGLFPTAEEKAARRDEKEARREEKAARREERRNRPKRVTEHQLENGDTVVVEERRKAGTGGLGYAILGGAIGKSVAGSAGGVVGAIIGAKGKREQTVKVVSHHDKVQDLPVVTVVANNEQ